MEKEYRLITGVEEDFIENLNQAVKDGWQIHGMMQVVLYPAITEELSPFEVYSILVYREKP